MHEENHREEACTQLNSSQAQIIACESGHLYENVLHLMHPLHGKLMEVENEVMVTWERSPDQVNDKDTGEPKQV